MTTFVKYTNGSTYAELLVRPEWAIKRKQILDRDKRLCKSCGTGSSLQVHHRQYHRYRATGQYKNPWHYPDELLITLCTSCHQKGHQNYRVKTLFV